MGRRAVGTIYKHGDHWDARVSLPDKSRPVFHLNAGLTKTQARAQARELAAAAMEGRLVQDQPVATATARQPGESCESWFDRWFKARAARGMARCTDDLNRVRKHVLPVLGATTPLATVGKVDIERLVTALDGRIHAPVAPMSWKTARNVWGLVSRAFKDACRSKNPSLRVREDNPCSEVAPPDGGADKAKCYLFPTEFLALVRCPRLPLINRRRYVLAVYLYARAGELTALSWDAIDLEHGTINVTESIERGGKRKSTKTGEARRFAIEPALMPLLRAMHDESGGHGAVLAMPADGEHLARDLRLDLKAAGVTRPELFTRNATHVPLSFHDLRATGITWMAVRGDAPLQIRHRAGHSDFATTEGYIREAEAVQRGFGQVFPPLPPELLAPVAREGVLETVASKIVTPTSSPNSQHRVTTDKNWWRRRESNPGPQVLGEDFYTT